MVELNISITESNLIGYSLSIKGLTTKHFRFEEELKKYLIRLNSSSRYEKSTKSWVIPNDFEGRGYQIFKSFGVDGSYYGIQDRKGKTVIIEGLENACSFARNLSSQNVFTLN